MVESRQTQLPKKKQRKKEDESHSTAVTAEKKAKLKELDEFIEGVLEEAGEEFLDEFKQVEGQ
jgi:hypothetical protein